MQGAFEGAALTLPPLAAQILPTYLLTDLLADLGPLGSPDLTYLLTDLLTD